MTAARKLVDPYVEFEEQKVPVGRVSRKTKRRVPATVMVCVLAASFVVVALIYLQLQITAYNLNIALIGLEGQVKRLEQRNDFLMLDLESQRSLQKIEHLARTKLGMVEPKQTTVLVVNQPQLLAAAEEGRWLVNHQEQAVSEGIFATLAAWFNKAFPLGGVEAGTLRR